MYVVIGANGFLGSYILKNIVQHTQDEIIAIARDIENVTQNKKIMWKSCDISNEKDVDLLCEEINGIKEKKVIFWQHIIILISLRKIQNLHGILTLHHCHIL